MMNEEVQELLRKCTKQNPCLFARNGTLKYGLFLFFAFYFKEGLFQLWESILKYYDIHLKLQYKVAIKYHLLK